jgi:hypothetical protein
LDIQGVLCREEYVGYPEEYNNNTSTRSPPAGLTNPVFIRTGTPVHGLLSRVGPDGAGPGREMSGGPGRNIQGEPGRDRQGGPGRARDRSSGASSSQAPSDLVLSSGDGGGGSLSPVPSRGGVEQEDQHSWHRPQESDEEPPPPVQRFSTAVQTMAPSTTATLMRQQNRLRNVSLV